LRFRSHSCLVWWKISNNLYAIKRSDGIKASIDVHMIWIFRPPVRVAANFHNFAAYIDGAITTWP
jgi:hypothetical protein